MVKGGHMNNKIYNVGDKVKIVAVINDAKAEAQRLRILDIMNKVCK